MPKKKQKVPLVTLSDPNTWIKYKKGMCNRCDASCCKLPVEATLNDLLRMQLIEPFDLDEPIKAVAKKLSDAKLIDHFNRKRERFTLARRANDDCIFLDQRTRRCTIYAKRPEICRTHPQIGPRDNYCAFIEKKT